ncbi:MAG: WD40 repeat domain-containing protein [Deltaproteobacteria bacterium]|nr:MAG: WD40 repeat domain-containing protein [Deltaproteobacteria bacterium]
MSYNKTDLYGDPLRRRIRTRYGTIRYRHAHPVADLAFALDGRMVATATKSGGVHVWKAATGKELLAVDAGVELHCVAISARGSALAASGADGVIRVWDTAYGKELHALEGHEEEVFSLAISPDGRWLASGGGARKGRSQDRVVRVWRLEAGRASKVLTGSRSAVRDVAFSPDGWRLAAVGDKSVRVWRLDGWEREHTLDGHEGRVQAASFSPDGEVVVTGGTDQDLRIWDLADGSCRRQLPLGHEITAIDVSPSGRVVVGDASGGVTVLELDGEPARFEAFPGAIRELAWAPDGEVVLAAAEGDRAVRLWHADGRPIVKGEGHFDAVVGVGFAGDQVVSVSADGELRRWERESGKPVSAEKVAESATCLALGDKVAVGTSAGVWVDGEFHASDAVHAVAASGPTLAVATSEASWLLGDEAREEGGDAIHVDIDGMRLASEAGVVGCSGPESLPAGPKSFSQDGVLLGVADGASVHVWDTREGVQLPVMQLAESPVTAIAFDRRRRVAAVGDAAGRVWLFVVETGRTLGALEGHVGPVTSLAFDTKSQALVSGGADTTVLTWDLQG